ncbi:hypothetical protein HYV81_06205 [Candidatus Woesearchaeota archaeon]|nr:hypothetical protein [Candidatus Woesearchaeota archaeon]
MDPLVILYEKDGPLHLPELKPDSRYVTPINVTTDDGKPLYEFDPKSGVLRLSMHPDDIGTLTRMLHINGEGVDMTLPNPHTSTILFFLPGVKEVLPIGDEYYFVKLQEVRHPGLTRLLHSFLA